jgi:hypothetical protein
MFSSWGKVFSGQTSGKKQKAENLPEALQEPFVVINPKEWSNDIGRGLLYFIS